MQCVGTENDILDCPRNEIGIHNCAHSEDAGAVCSNDFSLRLVNDRVSSTSENITEGVVEVLSIVCLFFVYLLESYRCIITVYGVPFVMTSGLSQRLELSAISWDLNALLKRSKNLFSQQEPLPY